MRRDQVRQVIFSLLNFGLLILSLQLISSLTSTKESDYTQGWLDIFEAILLIIFVSIPTMFLAVWFALSAVITELKIINDKRASGLRH
jgi:predicted membrane protein